MTIEVIHHEQLPTSEPNVAWIDATGGEVDRGQIQPHVDKVSREIARWVQSARGADRPSLFNRAAYVSPENPFAQMATARSAVENDDIVGGVCDVQEALMLQGLKWEADSADDSDIFNQLSRDLNLDALVRQWNREDFTYSQAVLGFWWGAKEIKLRGKGEGGRRRRKSVTIAAPLAVTFLDPTRVMPLTPGPFGQERLAWHATKEEYAQAAAALDGAYLDPVLREFTMGPANVQNKDEIDLITRYGMDYRRLLLLNPATVVRFSRTKLPYERFPAVRLKSVFPLLDLKQQLMEADRVSLVGAANYILLVKQGTEALPATQPEIDNLKENFKVVAKLPVVVGDHRLNIEIITPDQEFVLDQAKYDVLDKRILNRALNALQTGSSGERGAGSTLTRGIARSLENRRHMFKRGLEETIARRIVDHPANAGTFDGEPNLVFTPRNVQLDNDAEIARSIMSLRSSRDLSRESTLEYFGFDQAAEALRMEFEEEEYDDIFKTIVPFSSPNLGGGGDGNDDEGATGGEPPEVSGARGGRPRGGGESKQSPQGQGGGRSPSGNKARS